MTKTLPKDFIFGEDRGHYQAEERIIRMDAAPKVDDTTWLTTIGI